MKNRLFFYTLFFASLLLFELKLKAEKIDTLTAKNVAERFYNQQTNIGNTKSSSDITLTHAFTEIRDNSEAYHIFNVSDGNGFIIISADDRSIPVLGYSFESNFKLQKNVPPALQEWLNIRAEEIKSIQAGASLNPISRNTQWDEILNSTIIPFGYVQTDVSPLLPTNWNQGCGYNADCPSDASGPCGHVYAGCVATSMAQVMKYHNYPPSGTGSNSWTSSTYGEISADFGATSYNWADMPVPNGAYDEDVEQLLYHCGVAVWMNYGPTSSGSFVTSATNALINYFDYSSNAVYTCKSSYEDTTWAKLMMKECDAGRPIMYMGTGSGGHAFNLDGYQGTDYFHINWGWGGSYNGYFYLDDLTPGSADFTNSQCATVGIEPSVSFPGLDCSGAISLSCATPYAGTTIGKTNIVNHYGNCYYDATGSEVVHSFSTSMPGRISVVVTSDANLGIYLLSDCNQDSLIAYSRGSLIYDNSQPGNYFLVLDGTNGEEGDYSVVVNCPTSDADLIFLSSGINPYYIESSQSNVRADCEIKNIGNTVAGVNEIKYYFSSDHLIDGGDILIDSSECPATLPSETQYITKYLTMPSGLITGTYYILFAVDADSVVIESDDDLNTSFQNVIVSPAGTIDCSASVPLTSGIRYDGNTNIYGSANLENYSCANNMTDKEVIHSITPQFSGLAEIEYSERISGELNLIILPTCNENTCAWNTCIWSITDTLINEKFPVTGGTEYYFITDGKAGVAGDYSLKITLPDSCPVVNIDHWGELDRCIGSGSPNLYTNWGRSKYNWYRNGIKIDGAIWENYSPSEDGEYWVEVTENGCTVASDHLTVTYSPEPDTAHITALGNTIFCHDNSVSLDLYTLAGYTKNWAINGEPISGATSNNYLATESGIYTAQVTNISCTISSNTIEVIVNPLAVEPGDTIPVIDTGLISYFEFDGSNIDLSGNNNYHYPRNGVTMENNRYDDFFEAFSFDGIDDYVFTNKRFTDPDEFTLSIWFKTSTTKGGRLVGFGNDNISQSTSSDRQIYMSDDGRIHFGIDNGSPQTISSSKTYNDNQWHHVAASLSLSGTKLYIDGEIADSDPTVTNGGDYNGYWKFAYDTILPGYANLPTSNYFEGFLDEAKIYNWELLPSQIESLFIEQIITINLVDNQICGGPGSTDVIIANSQPGVEYQLRNNSDNSLIGSSIPGTGDTIYLPSGSISTTTTFNILATQISSGCENVLDSLLLFTVYEIPIVNLGADLTACDDTTLTDFSGNTYSAYNWSTGETSDEITVASSGIYSLIVTDLNGCSSSDTISVVLNDSPIATVSTTDSDCDSANGTTSIVASGGTGSYSYLWDSAIDNFSGADATDLPPGNYEVTVDDGICLTKKVFGILALGAPDISITVDEDSICPGETSNILITGADSYAWIPVDNTSTIAGNNFETNPDTTTIYYITGTVAGCQDTDTLTVYVKPRPNINLGSDTLICGTSYYIDAGEGFDSYLWSDETTGQSILADTNGLGFNTGIFSLTVTYDGCQNRDTIAVTFDACESSLPQLHENICKFYPNPSSGIVTFEFNEHISNPVRLIISDLQGRNITEFYIPVASGISKEIDLNNSTSNVFLVRIITENKVLTEKIIIR